MILDEREEDFIVNQNYFVRLQSYHKFVNKQKLLCNYQICNQHIEIIISTELNCILISINQSIVTHYDNKTFLIIAK